MSSCIFVPNRDALLNIYLALSPGIKANDMVWQHSGTSSLTKYPKETFR